MGFDYPTVYDPVGVSSKTYSWTGPCQATAPLAPVEWKCDVTPAFLATLPSLTPIWRAAEFQEREIFDLFGIVFTGHPDLRRLLMWDEFKDHPMRRDYVEPDDFEYEPTAHDEVMKRAQEHVARVKAAQAVAGQEGTVAGA